MKYNIDVPVTRDGLWLSENIVYSQTIQPNRAWYGAVRQMHLSLIRPYDESKRLPCIVWLCGGGWRRQAYNAYIPDLIWLAQRGYVVACVEYTCNELRFPSHIEQIKSAIRYLRAHADQYSIDKEKFGIMGGSAGAHLAGMVAVTNNMKEYDIGDYLNESSSVDAACTWYLPSDLLNDQDPEADYTQQLLLGYVGKDRPEEAAKACPARMVKPDTPPFLMLHGTNDRRVPYQQSEQMYEALTKNGVDADLYLINGASHSGLEFLQDPVCDIIGTFFDKRLKTVQ